MGALGQLLRQLGQLVPLPVLIAIIAALAIFGGPAWLHGVHAQQVRSQVRRVVRASTADLRRQEEERAIAMVAGKPKLIARLAEYAFQFGQRRLGERATNLLAETGKLGAEVERLRRTFLPPPPTPPHPIEAAANIRRLFGAGLYDAARVQLNAALQRFPEDETLQKFHRRFDQAEARARAEDARRAGRTPHESGL